MAPAIRNRLNLTGVAVGSEKAYWSALVRVCAGLVCLARDFVAEGLRRSEVRIYPETETATPESRHSI